MKKELFQPTHLKSLCERYGLTPSRHYGQHYLISEKPVEKMIEAGELKETDTVVEIGPGFGVLTLAMAPRVQKVIAFEIERKLEDYWNERMKEYGNIEIVWGNALSQFGVHSLSAEEAGSEFGAYKVLANLPYQITSDAMRTILEAEHKPEKVIVMVQKEVAERMASGKGDMNLLALSVQYYGNPRIVCDVPKGSFWPAPKVDSAVVAIDLGRQHNSTETEQHGRQCAKDFFSIARAGFSNPRKQLWGNLAKGLKMDGEKVKNALCDIAGDEKARAEDLSFEEWMGIVKKLSDLST